LPVPKVQTSGQERNLVDCQNSSRGKIFPAASLLAGKKGGYPWNIMILSFIKGIFVLSVMVGRLRIFPPTVFVASLTPLNML